MKRPLAVLALAISLCAGGAAQAQPRTVVVLLFDGFTPAAVEAWSTPALDRMRREGASSDHMEPPFPSLSLVAQASISTGCWPAHHGIVSNDFLDPVRGAYDHDLDADWLTGCEHLQQVAQRQGVTTAAYAWIGARSKTRGPQARIVGPDRKRCSGKPVDDEDVWRADALQQVLLAQPESRPHLILAYFCGPDLALHREGLHSDATRRAVEQSDGIVDRVLHTIERLSDRDRVTLIVTADHGMTEVDSLVNVRRILGRHEIAARVFSSGTTSYLYLDDPARAADAKRALAGYDEFDVLEKGALPRYAQLGDGPRVPQLIVSAHPPYFIEDVALWPPGLRWLADWGPDFIPAHLTLVGGHGYPPDRPGMHGIFYAWGSGIAAGRAVEKVRAIDIHPTVAHLLGIEPGHPVDGQIERALLAEEATP